MILRRFFDEKLAQASYLIACNSTHEAAVIDPARDPSAYVKFANLNELTIVAVLETHIHADYLSGGRELAHATDAKLYVSDEGGPDWLYAFRDEPNVVPMRDGDAIDIGSLTLKAIHTPGHTPEHLSFLLTDGNVPHSLFSGDFLFIGDVGRPDLLEKAAKVEGAMEIGAAALFESLKKLKDLPDGLLVWPGHGAGSACGKSLGDSPVSSLEFERRTNWALQAADASAFTREVLAGQPDPPTYFAQMKKLNREGAPILDGPIQPPNASAVVGQLVEIRDEASVLKSSHRDALILPVSWKSNVNWAGWLLNYHEPITLIASDQQEANAAARDLASIGLDRGVGWMTPEAFPPEEFSGIDEVEPGEVREDDLILDVRTDAERRGPHVVGSIHIPLGQLPDRLGEIERGRRVVSYCGSGGRSLIAASVLRRGGFESVATLAGGFEALERWISTRSAPIEFFSITT